MRFKRLIASIMAISMVSSVITVANADMTRENVLSAWGESRIALGSDFGIITKSDGNCYITNSDYDNTNFKRTFSTGKTVKVAVPKDLSLSQSYGLILRENGSIVGYNFNQEDLEAHEKQINSVKCSSGATDVVANDTKAVATFSNGTLKFTENDRGSVAISYTIGDDTIEETVYPPEENIKSWSNIRKLDIENDYVLGIGTNNRVYMSNSNEMTPEVIDNENGGRPKVKWYENWNESDYPDAMGSIQESVRQLTDIKDVDGTQNFVAYVKNDGTVGMIGGSIFNLNDEISTWTDIEKIAAYSEYNKALIAGVKSTGEVVTTSYGSSIIMEGQHDEQLNDIANIKDAKDIYISADSNYHVIVKLNDLSYKVIDIEDSTDWLYAIQENIKDTTKDISYDILFDNNIRKVSFSLASEYSSNYKLYIKKKIQGETISIDEQYKYNEPLSINENTEYEYIITKEINGVEIPSCIKYITININDIEQKITSNTESGVIANNTSVTFKVTYNDEELDGFNIKYIKVDQLNNDVIEAIEGHTIDEVKYSSNFEATQVVNNLNIKDYTDSLKIDGSCDIFVWSEDTNSSVKVNSKIQHFRYIVLLERPNIYPQDEYKNVYTEQDRQDILNGYRVTRRNTMSVKMGSYMSAALATNGEVWSSSIGTVSKDGMDIPTKYSNSVPSSEDSDEWLATRMWRMISDIAVGESHVVGLKIDGTVVASGNNDKNQCDVSEWTDIVDIAAGKDHTVGLKKDGTVIGTSTTQGDTEDYGQTQFSTWVYKYNNSLTEEENKELAKQNRIIAIEANNNNTIGLRNNGKVVVAGNNDNGQCNTDTWEDIVDIAMGTRHAVGLKSNGTVVAVGDNGYGQCNVSGWKDIVQISASAYETVGITHDGRVVRAGKQFNGALAVYGATADLVELQPNIAKIFCAKDEYGQYELSDSSNMNFVAIEKKVDDDISYDTNSFKNSEYRIDVYSKLNQMYKDGIKFKYVSSGNYTTALIDEKGIVYNIIHSEGPNEPSDTDYPLIQIDNENFSPVLDRGPTIINNYTNGAYNKELDVKLKSTTGEENNILWSLDNTDVYAMGTNSTSLTFDGAQVLNVAPYSLVGTRKINHPEIKYMYLLKAPIIKFSNQGVVNKGTQVTLSSTRPQKYKIYYTIDGSDPTFELDEITNEYKPNSSTKEYTGAISIDDEMTIKAKAFHVDNIVVSPDTNASDIFEANYEVTGGNTNEQETLIEATIISSDMTLTKAGSPYRIVNNLTIESGTTLTIEPGVVINVADGKGITVNGNLISQGTADDRITISSEGKWNGIKVYSQSGNDKNRLRFIDFSNATTALSVNAEYTRIPEGIRDLTFYNNDNGLNVQSDNVLIKNIKSYNNKNGFGIIISGYNTTITNCVITGNSIGIGVSSTNCNIKYCNIQNNETYGLFIDGGAAGINSMLNLKYNLIKDNYSISSETGKKTGYNIGCVDSEDLFSRTLDISDNYWGTDNYTEIMNTLPPAEKSPTFILGTEFPDENTMWADDLETRVVYIDADGNEVDSIENAKRAQVYIARVGGVACDASIIIALYNENGNLTNTKISNGITNIKTSDNDLFDDNYGYEIQLNGATDIRVMLWDSLSSMKPLI